MNLQPRIIIPAVMFGLGLIAGLEIGWKLYRPKPAPVETAAPAIRQGDQSLVLERKPETKPEPKHELPKGAKLERQIQVTVLPSIPTEGKKIPGSGNLPENPDSSIGDKVSPITVDLSLVRLQDGTQRVIASSDQGTVIGGLDVPVQGPMPIAKPLRWSGSVLRGYDAYKHQAVWGAAITYSRGPFVLTGGAIGQTAFVGVGVQF